ncbi:MAG TPA: serine/threonine-protein kinase [Nevskiaceae bacterium]|nr:serine/threonine-protein kinase [Nevskiaceae bacterium]
MKQPIWTRDWFAALAFAVVFVVAAYGLLAESFQGLERYAYDLGVQSRSRPPSERIAVIAIDDASIQNLGRWPWPRSLHARMIDTLKGHGSKVVVNTVFYSEAEQGGEGKALAEISAALAASPLATQIPGEIETFGAILADFGSRSPEAAGISQAYAESALATQYGSALAELQQRLQTAQAGLSSDDALAAAMRASGQVLLPMTFALGRPQGRPDAALPDYVRREALTNLQDRTGARAAGALPFPTVSADVPVPALGAAAAGIGHLNATPDVDGAVRSEPLVLQHFDEFYPSLALVAASRALNLQPQDVQVYLGEGLQLGGVRIGTTSALRMYPHFYRDEGGLPPFPVYSFFDVLEGKVQAANFRDKVVLIGATARGIGDAFATPVAPQMAPVLVTAHTLSSILQGDFYTRPSWAGWLELGVFLLAALYLALALPRLGPGLGFALSGGLVALLLVSQLTLLAVQALWIKLAIPAVFLLLGHLFLTVKKLRLTEKLRASSEVESGESNKMLGLAFQGQGQLDMAFEKFKRVQPVDDKLLDLFYNLALDFERKRQFNKAESVYQHIASHSRDYRDVQQKLSRAKKLSETVILGGGAMASTAAGTLVLAGGEVEKPMLGRYEVQKELGKGAMGVVYLGKDPKIGRQVAIKTMALSQEFEPDELASVKERFFREAETAGRLSHPNIVQIFDAGEEHDLAYIAMEFIKGHDLTKHVKPNALLPVAEVIKHVADAAEALDYAHGNQIVHRDIKPANMMLVEATRTIKLMDFGIARIADSSKTKTGMVLGTPSYMSPEQLAGKRVDGRSDLFSLGVTLYQLLTGSLPFQADSMATLMFKIANEAHPPLMVVRPDLPPGLEAVIEKVLQKSAELRYARGAELARDLRALAL